MIVPDFWAEARRQHKASGSQITVRRFGWSIVSEADALNQAEQRAQAALERILAGEKLNRREPKVAYNGATGIPIREEVLARHSEQVITRNGYGARCLNSPNALFADIDFEPEQTATQALVSFLGCVLLAAAFGMQRHSWWIFLALVVVSLVVSSSLGHQVVRLYMALLGGAERIALQRLNKFLSRHPEWSVRLYRTPAGLRVLAMHQPFEPASKEVQDFFSAIGADPLYVRMCLNQRCFRARLSAKPWRIGISGHMRPRPGIWPVRPERLAIRNAWIADYEARAQGFAACRFLGRLGSGTEHAALRAVADLHDQESKALVADLKLA